jgi:succinate-semialdehyde dehydrogenase/glutarate-semialdehyde dehydrogenase
MPGHPLISPNEGRVVGEWPIADAGAIEAVLEGMGRSARALASDRALRRAHLAAVRASVHAARDELAALVVLEVGKTPAEATSEVDYGLSFVDYAIELLDGYPFETRPEPTRRILEVPVGPALLITPFNDPIAGILRKVAPALAAGCPAIVKPSPLGMATALRLDRAFVDAGAGDCVATLAVTDAAAIERLIADDRIGIVSFTGSTAVGLRVAVAAAAAAKPSVTELGGNNPFVILEGADLDRAVSDLMNRKLRAAGQACSSVNRVYVELPVYAAVRDRIADRATGLTCGPSDTHPDLAPVISAEAVHRLRDLARAAEAQGARRIGPESRPAESGRPFLSPLVVVETSGPGPLDREEAFGPVMALAPFDDVDSLFARLSAERHMLAAYVYGANPDAPPPGLADLKAGSIGLDTTAIQAPHAPTGGFSLSGRGREGGVWGFREFLTTLNTRHR